MGVQIDLPGGMLNCFDKIDMNKVVRYEKRLWDMNKGCEIWMVLWNWSQMICMPRSQLGSPKSCILKLPLISCTILSITCVVYAARSPLSMYHPAMLSNPSVVAWKKMVVLASPGVKLTFCSLEQSVWCQTLPYCLSPYMLLLSLQKKTFFLLMMKPSGWCIYTSLSPSHPLRYAPLVSTCLSSKSFWHV